MRSLWKTLAGVAGALGLYAAATWLGVVYEKRAPGHASGTGRDLIYLPSPQQARLMALGFTNVVADYYWVRALQYFTDPTQSINQYKNLADFLEVVVGVDPDYEFAYKFAGMAIPYDSGRFRFVNTKRSTSFLERGVKRFPNNWQLHFFLGYNYLNFHNEPMKAAASFEAASKIPGAPTYFAAFAARIYSVGGDIDRALEFSKGVLASTTDPEIQGIMKARVLDLEVEKELRRIEAGAKAFSEATGRLPKDLAELVASGFPRAPPTFSLDAEGKAHTTIKFERMIIHDDKNQPEFRGD